MKKKNPFLIMGVLNITPDSFSDGGKFIAPEKAIDQAYRLYEDGADIIDLGAESSRPGSQEVPMKEEWQRLEPVLKALQQSDIKAELSVDSKKPDILLRSINYNVTYLNNIDGLVKDSYLTEIAKHKNVKYIAMHMHKTPETMQREPLKASEAISEVFQFMYRSHQRMIDAGFSPERIWLDPGIGFGKTDAANIQLLAKTHELAQKFNLTLGVSRKSWIGRTLSIKNPIDRDPPSKMMELGLAMAGAKMIRTHDVKALNDLRDLFTEE